MKICTPLAVSPPHGGACVEGDNVSVSSLVGIVDTSNNSPGDGGPSYGPSFRS